MVAANKAGANCGLREPNLLHCQELKPEAYPADIDDRVDRADLVEVHLVERNAVHAAFGAPERLENLCSVCLYGVGKTTLADQRQDRRQIALRLAARLRSAARAPVVRMAVTVGVAVGVTVGVSVGVAVGMRMALGVRLRVRVRRLRRPAVESDLKTRRAKGAAVYRVGAQLVSRKLK